MKLFIFYFLLLVGILVVFYFSWIPNPRLGLSKSLPDWISRWADENANENLRTAIPFIFLGFIAAIRLHTTRQPWYTWPIAWLGLIGVVTIAEAGQLLLPLRHFDWGDIAWGTVGSAVGILLTTLIIRLAKALS